MPNRFDMNPDTLRRLADAQEEAAARTGNWAKQPTDWLKGFPADYGSIATPVHRAMKRYYDARERAGKAMADQHLGAARSLRAAADSFEQADADGARRTSRVGFGSDAADHPVVVPGPGGPPRPGVPVEGSPPPAVGPITRGRGLSTPAGLSGPGPGPLVPPVSGPAGTVVSPPLAPANGVGPVPVANGVRPGPDAVAPAGAALSPLSGPSVSGGGPSGQGSGQSGPDGRPSAPTPPGGGGGSGSGTTSPGPTRFPAAVAAARERAADSARVSGEPVNDDLVVARTLLAAVLAATESTVHGVSWAVAVLRGSSGAVLFITTNEGRGWLPPGLFLPRGVSTPWLWDEVLDDGTGSPAAGWEGLADPARVLVEFGRVWGPKAGVALTALASSDPIDPRLRDHLGAAATEGMVGPANDVDLRVPTGSSVDRLGLTRPIEALEHEVAVPDSAMLRTRLRERGLELAVGAHLRLANTGPAPAAAAGVARLRDRITAMLQAGHEVPRQWWDELRAADELLAAHVRTRRFTVAQVGVGQLRVDGAAAALRALTFQRRCTELVLLLDGQTCWQQLRDEVYAHEQVVKHPGFADVPAVVVAPENGRNHLPVDVSRVTSESNEYAVSQTSASQISGSPVGPPLPLIGSIPDSVRPSDNNGRG